MFGRAQDDRAATARAGRVRTAGGGPGGVSLSVPLLPSSIFLGLPLYSSPIKSTWLGGARLASDASQFKDLCVSRQEYQERGSNWLLKHFAHRA